jgi:hypothetical protein
MKKIVIFAFLLLSCQWLNAQDVEPTEVVEKPEVGYYIVQTGMNISKFNSTANLGGIKPEYFSISRLNFAYMSEVPTNASYFFKQFGIRYSEMGTAYTDDKKDQVRLNYISLPVLFNFKVGTPVFKVYAGFGGYAALAFSGTIKEEGEIVSENILGWEYGSEVSPKYYHYGDAGILVGGGVQYILPNRDGIQLSCHYGFGLVPISNAYPLVAGNDDFNPKEFNRSVNISIAYMFEKRLNRNPSSKK